VCVTATAPKKRRFQSTRGRTRKLLIPVRYSGFNLVDRPGTGTVRKISFFAPAILYRRVEPEAQAESLRHLDRLTRPGERAPGDSYRTP
jgi:hypothetical protein